MVMKSLVAKVVLCVVVIEVIGALPAVFTNDAIQTWNATLIFPVGRPPNWVFGPVWATLFLLLGLSVALIWHVRCDPKPKKLALQVFSVQFALNLLWSPMFFGLQRMGLALIVIVLLWLAITLTFRLFSKIHPIAGWLLAPYLAWVSYATYLNAAFYLLNR